MRVSRKLLVSGVALLASLGAAATPCLAAMTAQEQLFRRLWADHLPEYCLYTQLMPDGDYGLYGSPVSKEYGKMFGPAFHHMHHYCFGLENTYQASLEDEQPARLRLYSQAVREFDYVLDRSTDDFVLKPEIYVNKGAALEVLGLYADAVEAYTNALTLKRDYVPAYIGLSNCFEVLGDPARALAMVDSGLQQVPGSEALLAKRSELTGAASVRPQ